MNVKRKIAWVLTGGLLWSTIFDGGYLIAAVAGQRVVETGKQTLAKEKDHRTDDSMDDENPDRRHWDKDDKALIEESAAWDIERKGGSYYYQGDRVKVIKDQSQNGSVYKFDPKLKGTVSIRIRRNTKGKMKQVSYLTNKEAARLIERAGLKDRTGKS